MARLLTLLAFCFTAHAQFEVASVKVSPPPDGHGMTIGCSGGPGTTAPGMITCSNLNLLMMLGQAYKVPYDQISAPDWIRNQGFEISAKVPAGATKEQVQRMWQQLLIERFKLALHREDRIVSKYDLVVAKGGPKFQATPDTPPAADPGASAQGFPTLRSPGMIGENGHITLYQRGMTMEQLAVIVSGQLSRPVDDKTGLNGRFDIRLFWVGENSSPDSVGLQLPQALQEQLGLRIEATKGNVNFVVVDHLEKMPTEN